jgi:hypothetical protein
MIETMTSLVQLCIFQYLLLALSTFLEQLVVSPNYYLHHLPFEPFGHLCMPNFLTGTNPR